MIAPTSIADEVDQLIKERSLLQHPFYQAWQKGELTLDRLRPQEWEAVRAAARSSLDALWSFLDGVYATAVPAGSPA